MPQRRVKGEGSVWRDKHGRWRGRVTIDGTSHYVTASTRREASTALAVKIGEVGRGEAIAPADKITVGALAQRWLDASTVRLELGELKPRTLDNYAAVTARWILPHLGIVALERLTPNLVTGWQADLKSTGLAPASVATAHRVLRAMLRYAEREQLVTRNAAAIAGGPRGVKPRREHLTQDEALRLLDALDGTHRDHAAVALGLAGLRRGEICGLQWSTVDLDAGRVSVVRQAVTLAGRITFDDVKSDASERTVILPAELLDVLKRWRRTQTEERLRLGAAWGNLDLVVTSKTGRVVDPDRLTHDLTTFTRAVLDRGVSPHVLRHTSASLQIAAGVGLEAVAGHLGHADSGVTRRIYVHLLDAGREQAAEGLGRALRRDDSSSRVSRS